MLSGRVTFNKTKSGYYVRATRVSQGSRGPPAMVAPATPPPQRRFSPPGAGVVAGGGGTVEQRSLQERTPRSMPPQLSRSQVSHRSRVTDNRQELGAGGGGAGAGAILGVDAALAASVHTVTPLHHRNISSGEQKLGMDLGRRSWSKATRRERSGCHRDSEYHRISVHTRPLGYPPSSSRGQFLPLEVKTPSGGQNSL